MTSETERRAKAGREKRRVALLSVLAAVLLTGTKLVVGLATNSLGILSEAAHSGLDLLAAVMTLWAVRVADLPADREHTYGHGKIENLSALLETGLLLATCAWVALEAWHRLSGTSTVHVDANAWAFATVVLSIVIDFSRSRALKRAAVAHGSQALEADALHFATDIWSSAVVLVGLALVRAAAAGGPAWLRNADAIAALGVAAIVVVATVRLGKRAIDDLLDAVPRDLQQRVREAARVPGVREITRARVRRSGPQYFADITVVLDAALRLERAHDIATRIEQSVAREIPHADVVVHVEPDAPPRVEPPRRAETGDGRGA